MSDTGEFEEELTLLDIAREGEIEPFAELLQTPQGVETVLATRDEFSQANVLHMAAANGHSELLKFVLEKLPEDARQQLASARNESGNTPMHWAALTGSLASVQLLVAAGADPLAKNAAGLDPIYQAENAGQEEVATYLCGVADLHEFDEAPGNGADAEVNAETNAETNADAEANAAREPPAQHNTKQD